VYARIARRYDERWARYVRATVEQTARRTDLADRRLLLDVGCGTGAFLKRMTASEPGPAVVGCDVTPEMLEVASLALGTGARLTAADAHALPFGDATFDIVTSISSFHFWQRPALALSEIARVMTPGAELVITDWCDDFLACWICDRVLRFVDRAHRRSYGTGECRRMLEVAGFEVVSIERYRIDWLWGLMSARARKTSTNPAVHVFGANP